MYSKLSIEYSTSYRDLLGTAESIIEMDGEMQQVESYFVDMGRKCDARLLEKKNSNLRSWDAEIRAKGTLHQGA